MAGIRLAVAVVAVLATTAGAAPKPCAFSFATSYGSHMVLQQVHNVNTATDCTNRLSLAVASLSLSLSLNAIHLAVGSLSLSPVASCARELPS